MATGCTHSVANRWSSLKAFINTSIETGKYLVSPLTQLLADGRYRASVSIRTGRGSATHDRVMRFIPLFDSQQAAAAYATEEGLTWARAPLRNGSRSHDGVQG